MDTANHQDTTESVFLRDKNNNNTAPEKKVIEKIRK